MDNTIRVLKGFNDGKRGYAFILNNDNAEDTTFFLTDENTRLLVNLLISKLKEDKIILM